MFRASGKCPLANSSSDLTSRMVAVPRRRRSSNSLRDTGSNSSRARNHPGDLGAVALADSAEGSEQTHHLVASKPVINALAVASARYERSSAQKLQMSGCIGQGEAPRAARSSTLRSP